MNRLGEIVVRSGNVISFPVEPKVQSVKDAVIDALNANEIGLSYQPQYDLSSGAMIGAEALLTVAECAGRDDERRQRD